MNFVTVIRTLGTKALSGLGGSKAQLIKALKVATARTPDVVTRLGTFRNAVVALVNKLGPNGKFVLGLTAASAALDQGLDWWLGSGEAVTDDGKAFKDIALELSAKIQAAAVAAAAANVDKDVADFASNAAFISDSPEAQEMFRRNMEELVMNGDITAEEAAAFANVVNQYRAEAGFATVAAGYDPEQLQKVGANIAQARVTGTAYSLLLKQSGNEALAAAGRAIDMALKASQPIYEDTNLWGGGGSMPGGDTVPGPTANDILVIVEDINIVATRMGVARNEAVNFILAMRRLMPLSETTLIEVAALAQRIKG